MLANIINTYIPEVLFGTGMGIVDDYREEAIEVEPIPVQPSHKVQDVTVETSKPQFQEFFEPEIKEKPTAEVEVITETEPVKPVAQETPKPVEKEPVKENESISLINSLIS